jgi:hypothetical protein
MSASTQAYRRFDPRISANFQEKSMKITMREWLCAVALGAFAVGAQAQSTDASKPAGTAAMDATAKAEADFKVAKEACDAKSGAEKNACLKDAMDARDRATGKASATTSTPATTTPK